MVPSEHETHNYSLETGEALAKQWECQSTGTANRDKKMSLEENILYMLSGINATLHN